MEYLLHKHYLLLDKTNKKFKIILQKFNTMFGTFNNDSDLSYD